MADSILRLRVDSQEYDSKIKKAAEGIAQLAEHARRCAGGFTNLEKADVNFIRALGDMETKARSAAGKTRELESAFKELTVVYNNLSDAEKNGEGGKALAASLDKLRQRAIDAREGLNEATRALQGNEQAAVSDSSGIEGLTSVIGGNINAMLGWGAAIAAVKGALDVAKEAFLSTESNIDEWGREMEGAKNAYDVFLQTLNGGNWDNFFQNLATAIQGGRDLYDTLDRLGSVKANNQAAIAMVQAQIQELRVLKQHGKDVDDQIKAATSRLKALQMQSVTAGKRAGREEITTTLSNRIAARNTVGVAIKDNVLDRAADRLLKEGQAYIDGMKKVVEAYERNPAFRTTTVTSKVGFGGRTYEQEDVITDLSKMSELQKKQYLVAKAIVEGETSIQLGISTFAQAVNEETAATREEFKGNRYAGLGGKGGKTTPQEKAATKIEEAERTYSETILKATLRMDVGLDTTLEYKKKELAAQERLFDAYNEAYATYSDPAYKEAATKAAEKMTSLAGEVKQMEDAVAAARVKWERGLSGFNAQTMSAWMQGRQGDLQKTEYGTAEYKSISGNIADMTTLKTILETAIKNNIDAAQFDLAPLWEKIFDGDNIEDSVWTDLVDKINEKLAELELDPIKINLETGNLAGNKELAKDAKNTAQAWQSATAAINSAGSALQNLEDPGAKVAGIVAQAVANIALGFAQATASPATGIAGVFGWIAATTAGLATMVATIASVKSATKGGFASGGIVPGNSYSGDNLRISDYGINSGELILNHAQQNNLANELRGGVGEAVKPQIMLTGDKLYVAINNYLRMTGKGQLVVSQ